MLAKDQSISEIEAEALAFWENKKIFSRSVEREAKNGDFVFYDGPPFATGTPHYGHLVGGIIKDVIPRFATMNNYRVERKWGWDCHGLPIENIVEKELGTKTKKEIEALGVEKFNNLCRTKVDTYIEEWKKVVSRLGRFVDMENSYRTMDLNFMESVWWAFKTLWDKGLIYKDHRSMHVCPRCETTLSQSEVSEGYKDIKDLSVTAKFKLKAGQKISDIEVDDKTFVLAWTTTPWTLIGNVALAVGEEIDYVLVERNEGEIKENLILAKSVFEEMDSAAYKIISEFKGSSISGLEYEALYDYYAKDEKLVNRENGWKIYSADFVTTDEGVGVVHIAPAFGEDDMRLGKEKSLPFIQHVGMDGVFREEVKDFSGLHVKPIEDHTTTDIEIIKNL
ncbi:class I tRNA ligase family protein, partial [Patescibacteria group bacterium]|nr:class I tRNA ligase family protein [Patescibacteria group bacterium]